MARQLLKGQANCAWMTGSRSTTWATVDTKSSTLDRSSSKEIPHRRVLLTAYDAELFDAVEVLHGLAA